MAISFRPLARRRLIASVSFPPVSAFELVIVLGAFLVTAGFMALVVLRAVRDGTDVIDTAAWIVVLAFAFAVVSIFALEQVLPRLERALF